MVVATLTYTLLAEQVPVKTVALVWKSIFKLQIIAYLAIFN